MEEREQGVPCLPRRGAASAVALECLRSLTVDSLFPRHPDAPESAFLPFKC